MYPWGKGRAWELIGDHDGCVRREEQHRKLGRAMLAERRLGMTGNCDYVEGGAVTLDVFASTCRNIGRCAK